jgi:hypothetical protein
MTTVLCGTVLIIYAIQAFAGRWRRVPPPAPPRLDGLEDKIAQLQQSVDTIALEVERISEGQRFTTKLLAERAEAKK